MLPVGFVYVYLICCIWVCSCLSNMVSLVVCNFVKYAIFGLCNCLISNAVLGVL